MVVNSSSNTSVVKCEGGSEEEYIVIVSDVEGGGVEWKDGFSVLRKINRITEKRNRRKDAVRAWYGTISYDGWGEKEGGREGGGRAEDRERKMEGGRSVVVERKKEGNSPNW